MMPMVSHTNSSAASRRGATSKKLIFLWLVCQQLVACSAGRLLLQDTNDVSFPWFTGTGSSARTEEANPPNGDPSSSSNMQDSARAAPGPAPRAAPSPEASAPSPSNSTLYDECPRITLSLNAIEVYDSVIDRENSLITMQCYSNDADKNQSGAFPPVAFSSQSDTMRSSTGARYRPNEPVAQIGCGESISCVVAYSDEQHPSAWVILADGGCFFDYRHFTQLSFQESLSAWTCTKPPVRYTLECVECADPNFPWERAVALAGPPLTEADSEGMTSNTLNSAMVIISVSVIAGAIILVVTALLLRSRRRSSEENARMTEMMMSRARREGREHRRRRPAIKPPALFVVGEPCDGLPPEGYTGPIVVLHCGEGEEEENGEEDGGESRRQDIEAAMGSGSAVNDSFSMTSPDGGGILRWPHIAIARPERPRITGDTSAEDALEAAMDEHMEVNNEYVSNSRRSHRENEIGPGL